MDSDSVHAWGSATKYDISVDGKAAKAVRTGTNELKDGKEAVDVVADFVKKVYNHTMSELAFRLTRAIPDCHPITFVLPVPATRSDKARSDTIAAMKITGFSNRACDVLRLITEPETAMIATWTHFATGRGKKSIFKNSAGQFANFSPSFRSG